MDTAAYLSSQGWAGHGHALHYNGRGIKKAILVSQKNNVLGIGKKKYDVHADQWWARAFDETLKGIHAGKDEFTGRTEGVVVTDAAKQAGLKMLGGLDKNTKGLYSCFVKGSGLEGTLRNQDSQIRTGESEGDGYTQGSRHNVDDEAIPTPWKERRERAMENQSLAVTGVTEVDSSQRDVESKITNELDEVTSIPTKERRRKKKKKQRRDGVSTDEAKTMPRIEPTEKERRKQSKKARKEKKATLAIKGAISISEGAIL